MAFNITLPTNVSVIGRFWKVEDRLSNGLGAIFQMQIDGTSRRVFF